MSRLCCAALNKPSLESFHSVVLYSNQIAIGQRREEFEITCSQKLPKKTRLYTNVVVRKLYHYATNLEQYTFIVSLIQSMKILVGKHTQLALYQIHYIANDAYLTQSKLNTLFQKYVL